MCGKYLYSYKKRMRLSFMQYRLRHPSFVASRHLLPRSGRRRKVSAIILFVQRILLNTIIQLVKEEHFIINIRRWWIKIALFYS